jgi:hypothetical protein
LLKESAIATSLAKSNFEKLADMEALSIDKLTNLNRRQVITLYTMFTAMYMFEFFNNRGREVDCKRQSISVETFHQTSKILGF